MKQVLQQGGAALVNMRHQNKSHTVTITLDNNGVLSYFDPLRDYGFFNKYQYKIEKDFPSAGHLLEYSAANAMGGYLEDIIFSAYNLSFEEINP